MSAPETHSVRFGRVAPPISERDIGRALAFYEGVLCFTKVFENGSPVGFVILEKDDAELHLSLDREHRETTQRRAPAGRRRERPDDHLSEHGTRIVKGVRDADYGMRTFVFADPDGNRIDVGEDL